VSKAELLARTKIFSLRILKLADHLPRTMSGRVIGNQLVRCGTSVGANYRAACRSRSRAEFAAKLGIVAEEYDELLEAVRSNDRKQVMKELEDIAVACVFAFACDEEDGLEW